MKTILSGASNPRFEALPDYLAAALARLGHQVTWFDHRDFLLPGRLRQRWPLLDRLDRERLNARLVRLALRVRPDLLIVNQGVVLTRRTIERLRDQGVRCVNWFSDYPAEFDAGLRMADAYDSFFLGSSFAAARHREAGLARSFWLPFGCDPETHRPEATETGPAWREPENVPPVVFIGSHYPERQVLLRFLRGLSVGVWGPGWERAADDPIVRPMIRGGPLRPAAWRRLYARAKVVLNIHYGAFGPIEASGDLASTRVFEILACGAFQVVNRQGDVLRLFRDGEHLSVFSNGEEMRARVEQGLADDARRLAVARAGRAEVLARHTYEHRAGVLLDPAARDFVPAAAAWPPARSGAAGGSR